MTEKEIMSKLLVRLGLEYMFKDDMNPEMPHEPKDEVTMDFLFDQVESLYRSYYILKEFYNKQNVLIHQIKVATGTVWAPDEMVIDAVKKAVEDQEKYNNLKADRLPEESV